VVFFGDCHVGSKFCLKEKAQAMIDYCVDKGIYIMCMGDLVEAANKNSPGVGVYEQIDPNDQIDQVIAMLSDAAKKGLILGYLQGNHEFRIMKETGVDICRIICRELKVPYLGFAGWHLWYVGKQSYTVYTIHGSSSARFPQTKLKAAMDIASNFDAQIVAVGHMHDVIVHPFRRQKFDKGSKQIIGQKSYVVVTGHYLQYYGSYSQMKGYSVGNVGSPKFKLYSERNDIHESN